MKTALTLLLPLWEGPQNALGAFTFLSCTLRGEVRGVERDTPFVTP